MVNMSYCMCENTLGALQEVIDAVEQNPSYFISDLSASEKRAFKGLLDACNTLLELTEDIDVRDKSEDFLNDDSEGFISFED